MNIAWFVILSSVCVYCEKNISYCLDREEQQGPESGEWFLQHVHSDSELWFWFYNTESTPSLFSFSCCRGGGVLDNPPGPVPEHQHHVHPLSESSHSSRPGSQHQVRWCVTCTWTRSDCWSMLQLMWKLSQVGQWQRITGCCWKHFQIRVHQTSEEIQQLEWPGEISSQSLQQQCHPSKILILFY